MNNLDIEKIGRIIDDIERYLNDLKEMNIKEEKDLTCKERFYVPFSYRDMFECLYRENVIDKIVRDKMIMLVYYRNLIAHEYHKFNEKDILKFVNEITISERFLEQIRNFIKVKNENEK